MKNKNFVIMIGIFIVLVIVYFFTSYKPREVKQGATPLFKGEKPSIDKLEISRANENEVVIEKINGVWQITSPFEYKASATVVDETVSDLQSISVDGVVSTRKEVQDEFDISDSTGIFLKACVEGKPVLDAVVGKVSNDYSHTFARLRNSNEITLWRGTIGAQIDKTADEWRDKSVFSLIPNDIISVKSVQGSTTRELALNDTTWIYMESSTEKPIDQSNVKKFIDLIATLNCDAFADEGDISRADKNEPDTMVTLTLRDGQTHSFYVWTPGEDDNDRYLVRLDGKDVLFRFYKYRGEQLVIDYERMKSEEG